MTDWWNTNLELQVAKTENIWCTRLGRHMAVAHVDAKTRQYGEKGCWGDIDFLYTLKLKYHIWISKFTEYLKNLFWIWVQVTPTSEEHVTWLQNLSCRWKIPMNKVQVFKISFKIMMLVLFSNRLLTEWPGESRPAQLLCNRQQTKSFKYLPFYNIHNSTLFNHHILIELFDKNSILYHVICKSL